MECKKLHPCINAFRLTIVNNFDSCSGRWPLENTYCFSFWWDLHFESKALTKLSNVIIKDAHIVVVSTRSIRERHCEVWFVVVSTICAEMWGWSRCAGSSCVLTNNLSADSNINVYAHTYILQWFNVEGSLDTPRLHECSNFILVTTQ